MKKFLIGVLLSVSMMIMPFSHDAWVQQLSELMLRARQGDAFKVSVDLVSVFEQIIDDIEQLPDRQNRKEAMLSLFTHGHCGFDNVDTPGLYDGKFDITLFEEFLFYYGNNYEQLLRYYLQFLTIKQRREFILYLRIDYGAEDLVEDFLDDYEFIFSLERCELLHREECQLSLDHIDEAVQRLESLATYINSL